MSRQQLQLESHLNEQLIENARFVMETAGLSLEMVARRLGVTPDRLEKALDREQRKNGRPQGEE